VPAVMLSAGVRHSEKSNSTNCSLPLRFLGDTDVFGLDVAVGHALGFEMVDRFDQLFAEALQHVERQAAFFLELLGQGPVRLRS
jgi:hypothetical protein